MQNHRIITCTLANGSFWACRSLRGRPECIQEAGLRIMAGQMQATKCPQYKRKFETLCAYPVSPFGDWRRPLSSQLRFWPLVRASWPLVSTPWPQHIRSPTIKIMQKPSPNRWHGVHPSAAGAARSSAGFTAIELMVVVAIVAILTALAGPSFRPLVERWRVRDTAESLTATLYLARSEAIKRGGNVTIDKRATCATFTSTTGWGCGWTVSHTAGTVTTILQESTEPTRVDVALTGATDSIAVDRWGMMSPASGAGAPTNMAFTITPGGKSDTDISAARLCASSGGRIVRKKGTETC